MKAVMYHYVRPETSLLPKLNYLHVDDFVQQLDCLEQMYGFVSRERFLQAVATAVPTTGVVLTFDDGFADHRDHVAPILADRGLWGIFYVPTGPYIASQLLDVHRIHVLLGALGGDRCMQLLRPLLHPDMVDGRREARFGGSTYTRQRNDPATLEFKRTLNYYLSRDERASILGELIGHVLEGATEADFAASFYVGLSDLGDLEDAGNIIGSHTVQHLVMSELTFEEQRREIDDSFALLADAVGHPIETFAYPFGGSTTYTADTQAELDRVGCRYSFAVEPADVVGADLRQRHQALPRYDCNAFPFGQVRER